MRGTVKFFNLEKGYGFIHPDAGDGRDVFVHVSCLAPGTPALKENDQVEFDLARIRERASPGRKTFAWRSGRSIKFDPSFKRYKKIARLTLLHGMEASYVRANRIRTRPGVRRLS